jgi:branched-chain amino acid transport system ATP-binding protein
MSLPSVALASPPAGGVLAQLEVDDVSVTFGGLAALTSVSFTALPGYVTGLIGPNGAGKTTLFNVITGLQSVRSGTVRIAGTDVAGLKPHQRARLGLARTFQRLEVFVSLTVYDNVRTAAEVRGRWSRDGRDPHTVACEAIERVGMTEESNVRVDSLPTGHARLVELARALATRPKLLLLDEPASGLDDDETKPFGELLVQLAREGLAVVLVEHDVDLVMQICDVISVLDFGQIIATGTPAEIRANAAVRAAYLGGSDVGV